ncbi:MAG: hypothetical protein ABSA12_17075 [Verrucomicrobiia bacterium]
MNRKYLGDALDHWKGSLFECLQASSVLRDFAVDPMATDLPDWQPQDFSLLAKLLRVNPNQIIQHEHGLRERSKYFGELSHAGDLFLDPDTGIATGSVTNLAQYVRPKEIGDLIAKSAGRLVAVYQHVRAQRVNVRVNAVLAALSAQASLSGWCSYESGTVAMLFLARDLQRVDAVRRTFSELLGSHAKGGRIRSGEFSRGFNIGLQPMAASGIITRRG